VTNADYSNSGLALGLLRVCMTRLTVLSCVLWGMAIIHMILQMGFAASWPIPTDAISAK
jgi:hypothetical protein